MGDVVDLPTSLLEDQNFILTLARFADGLVTEAQVRKRYKLDDNIWKALAGNEALVAKIEAEKERRIRCGDTARERAQQLFASAPTVLGNILNDGAASPRHRIESAKELRAVAANGPEVAATAGTTFQIIINLGDGDTIKYPPSDEKPNRVLDVSPKVIEHDTHDDDVDEQQLATPWGL